MNTKNVTIYDIADALDLSASTISRALSGSVPVSKSTRDKIFEKAKDLGYRRNEFATNLRNRRTRLIGALMPQLNTSFIASVVSGAEITASHMGYDLIVRQSMRNPNLQIANVGSLNKRRVEGFLVASTFFQEHGSLKEILKAGIPAIVIEASSLLRSHPKKKESNYDSAYDLTAHLAGKGCKRIAYISIGTDEIKHAEVFQGYSKALEDNGLKEADKLILAGYDFVKSTDVCRQMLSSDPRPDGILFSDNIIAALSIPPSRTAALNNDGYAMTCMTRDFTSNNDMILELGRAAAWMLIALIENVYGQ